ncbi:hypothetical protein P7K49_015592 [Saguinus oedipus]|uniref:Uncharacterized protein n=1 Tax=Saguinus oedipus TaxID=9490 RepID=A0ABQ9V9P6_SAGOE|nr:hypothetical protein P7K49_015592 [Saguinus oedipus]
MGAGFSEVPYESKALTRSPEVKGWRRLHGLQLPSDTDTEGRYKRQDAALWGCEVVTGERESEGSYEKTACSWGFSTMDKTPTLEA